MAKRFIQKSYLTPNQVAELLMVSPTTIRQWAEKGELNALTTPGGHRRFLPAEIERFAQERGLILNSGVDSNSASKILIADDDEQLREYLAELLKGLAHQVEVETAKDGFEAGLKINEFMPHILLLDLLLPGLDGFKVCRQLKAGAKTKDIRVIAISGQCSNENVEKIMAAGAEACLPKPLDEKLLLLQLCLGD